MLFPVFLKLSGRKVVLVGGGPVASAKLASLVGTGAETLVVAPELTDELVQIAAQPQSAGLTLARRSFQPGDLDGAWLAIAAATREVNRQVAAAANQRRVFLVAVDDPEAASAYGGGVVRRGGVTIAISTDGEAPALAGLLREGMDALLPPEIEAWVGQAKALRPAWREQKVPMANRRPLLLEALNRMYGRT
jgi:uroporphyrin-III C-methyltransferase/precorrin-2 dehydrogenase/sirohydrochlorin ferrochelatase